MAPDPRETLAIAVDPDGVRYKVHGLAKDWHLGTGSLILDVVAFFWAVVRRARGKEWTVTVRLDKPGSDALVTRTVESYAEAVDAVKELAGAIETGQFTLPQ